MISRKIGEGGYGKIFHPPRHHVPTKYHNPKFIQRYTHESKEQIYRGEAARIIFDPKNVMSSPIIAVFRQPEGWFSEILPYRKDSLSKFIMKNKSRDPSLFWRSLGILYDIYKGMARLHERGYIHRDIKLDNFLYNRGDDGVLRYFLIDWGTALPFSEVYNRYNNNWHVAPNENLPPEYKNFAYFQYPGRIKDFVRESMDNRAYPILVEMDRKYRQKLEKSFRTLQARLRSSKNPVSLMASVAEKADVFALGLLLAQIYGVWVRNDTPLAKDIIDMIRGMTAPDPFLRWDMNRVVAHTSRLLQSHALIPNARPTP